MPHPTSRLRIVRSRRAYSRWAADQTFEDYALRFTARSARTATPMRAALTALGSISFLALEAMGGTLTLAFGFANTAAAIALVTAVIFTITLPLCVTAARAGLDIDLLTRGTGFGYIGSTITSLLYASFTFIFFGLEAAILAGTLHILLGMPLWLAYLLCAAIIIPLVMWGITFIARFQIATQPVWFMLNIVPLAVLAAAHPHLLHEWTHSGGLLARPGVLDPIAIGTAASLMIVLVCQSAEQIDFLRFLPPPTATNRRQWWTALVLGGPGWVVLDAFKLLAGSFLAWIILRAGFPATQAVQPGLMYRFAWGTFTPAPVATFLTVALVALAQVKVNITNAYAGSLAWSNFFSRLTHTHPGRVFYVIFNVAIALVLMEAGLVSTIQTGITLYGVLACAWIGAIVGDVTICKPLGLSPALVEFKRALLPDFNIVGLGAWALGAGMGMAAYWGAFGRYAGAYAPFLTLAVACVTVPVLAWLTRGRTYLARELPAGWNSRPAMKCVICEHIFEAEDMASCPAYGGTICSLCCSLDGRCRDRCKPVSTRMGSQIASPLRALPPYLRRWLMAPGGRFSLLLGGITLGLGLLAWQMGHPWNGTILLVFVASAIGAWLLVMTQEGRRTATQETLHQTRLLMNEIRARRRTDHALKLAREKAEAASLAKTRYISGISHEIRSPLNAIMGYIQLLQHDARLPPERHKALGIMRESGEHITSILSGLLDISRIEAGRIELHADTIALPAFLESVAQMIRPQAQAKGLNLAWQPGYLPAVVTCDEHRLRQILLNLLSNAVKFTRHGSVTFSARWYGQIAEFIVADTGPGIAEEDHARIFEPFERGAATAEVPGTGLGLTITRLLTEILGGELTFTSRPGGGSRFRVRLMLSDRQVELAPQLPAIPIGHEGPRRTVLVVDDNAEHRLIMREILERCGFVFEGAESGTECLDRLPFVLPDLLLLDLSMPGMDGRDLALRIRQSPFSAVPIMFLTGNLLESANRHVPSLDDCPVLGKPVNLSVLVTEIGQMLGLTWVFPKAGSAGSGDAPEGRAASLPEAERATLLALLNGGNMRRLREYLVTIQTENPALRDAIAPLGALAAAYQLEALRHHLEPPGHDNA
ncbi:hybrid sensor histidine kinase/response regulator [Komagataeibacter swingsii]|uniref:histidine kinase n=1 Tax=Komagataeibacter swingsii TaxID=215220 RepID=A0A850P2I9_9PROT|nr:ATP-binding protein [Komagataeibacter swingsii]NVN38158.1 response regulator [Komagataeibacter swingsii]